MSLIDRSRCIARQRGTAVGYRYYGCRCPQCREAHRVHHKRHREHRLPPALVDATQTQCRIQALLAGGFTGTDIARVAGWDSRRRVHHLLSRRQIRPRTVEVIARVYSELAGTPGRPPSDTPGFAGGLADGLGEATAGPAQRARQGCGDGS